MAEIYPADFGDGKNETRLISELFGSIQFYRERKKSLADIHAAFCRPGVWRKSCSSFSRDYIQA